MSKLLNTPLLIVGLLAPIATKAEIYDALCDVSQLTPNDDDASIKVSNCQITFSAEGFTGPKDFIPKDNISSNFRPILLFRIKFIRLSTK